MLAVACGNGSTGAIAGGGDTGDDGVIQEAGALSTCGDPPWVTASLQVLGISIANPAGSPVPGVAMTSPLCPDVVQYSDPAGVIQGRISKDVPFYASLQKNAYLPELTPEEFFAIDQTVSFEMLPITFSGLLQPPFVTGSSNAILIAARATGSDAGAGADAGADAGPDGGSCSQLDGIVFSVTGYPQAQVTYYSAGAVPMPIAGGTATSSSGFASISGLAPAQFVTVIGVKPGCHVTLQNATLTGRVRVEQGFVSLVPAYVSP
jgi:hypothetical protein